MLPLRVDDRVGSRELVAPLRERGLPAEMTRLDYGDVCWVGNGPEGPVLVGVELKTIGDLLSCIISQRFTGHQLPGLQDCYAVTYLLVEGEWKAGPSGELLIRHGTFWSPVSWGKKQWGYRELDHWLSSVEQQGGVCLWPTAGREETVSLIHSRYSWWTSKDWGEHKTVKSAYQELKPFPTCKRLELVKPKSPSRLRRMYAQVFGWETSTAVEQRFAQLGQAVRASDSDWLGVPGVGKEMLRRWKGVL